jgi:hypothetical protein
MSIWDAYGGATLAFAILGGIFGAGFAAGYKGTWKHTAAAVGANMGIFLLPQAVNLALYHFTVALNEVLGGIIFLAFLITSGSLIGALIGKRSPARIALAYHGVIAGGTILNIEILSRIGKR